MKRWIFCGACIVAIAFLGVGSFLLVKDIHYVRNDVCVMNENPRRVIDGLIVSSGAFGAGPVMYFLHYEGEYKLSKQMCRYKVGVTKEEYERKIYGVEK